MRCPGMGTTTFGVTPVRYETLPSRKAASENRFLDLAERVVAYVRWLGVLWRSRRRQTEWKWGPRPQRGF